MNKKLETKNETNLLYTDGPTLDSSTIDYEKKFEYIKGEFSNDKKKTFNNMLYANSINIKYVKYS